MSDKHVLLTDNEYHALKAIEDGSTSSTGKGPSQRDIARALGMSVGMTNAIIKRLAEKGWLVINKVNERNLSYVLTADGAREVARRSYRYLRRTLGNVVRWKDRIDAVVAGAKALGRQRVLLVGSSDVEFIVEHAAGRHGMVFVKTASEVGVQLSPERLETTYVVYSERKDRPETVQHGSAVEMSADQVCYLKEVLL